jgi:hypothetical protein
VVRGEVDEAESVYVNAIARFGADSSAVVKLEVLRDHGVHRVDAESMLKRYFGTEEL